METTRVHSQHTGQRETETTDRRESSERDRVRGFYAVHEMFDGNQNAWDAVERRERLSEACYDV